MLLIIRGLPGSGKSTLAQEYVAKGYQHYEADMYFMRDGTYTFDQSLLREAHAWCRLMTFRDLKAGKDVVVSNTFVKHWEYQPYIDFCNEHNIPYGIKVASFSYANVHNVSPEVISRMMRNWED